MPKIFRTFHSPNKSDLDSATSNLANFLTLRDTSNVVFPQILIGASFDIFSLYLNTTGLLSIICQLAVNFVIVITHKQMNLPLFLTNVAKEVELFYRHFVNTFQETGIDFGLSQKIFQNVFVHFLVNFYSCFGKKTLNYIRF